MIIGRFNKQPVERLDYDIDFSEFLGSDSLVVDAPYPLVSISSTENPATLTSDSVLLTNSNTFAKVTLSGGTTGVSYKVTVTVKTAGGRIKQTEFIIKCKDD